MSDLLGDVIDALQAKLPEMKVHGDRHSTTRYAILKLDGKTIGYVGGKRKVRVNGPDRQSIMIVHEAQLPLAVDFIMNYVQEAAT